ncbi:MAG: hypothetical protein COA66_05645 [Arcobacter sp.]|nr:MAG: hypothetical protein COA66_05645 [Arcobacter sp.]
MISALWTGISGLATQQKALDNEAHNIANVNTVGYKATRISFADQLYQDKIGKGSKVLDAEKIFTQGGRKQTGVAYDMALNGEGFFAVTNSSSSGTSEVFYTRAGNFRMGDNGTLQDAQGNEVQGWAMSAIDPQKDVLSTNPDTSVFTDLYTELLSSKVVKYSNYIETVTAKATDYSESAVKDAEIIYNGAGAKSKAAKTSDVDILIQSYTSWLEKLQAEPDALSSTSTSQVSQLNFKGDTLKKEGDQIYVFIDGDKIAQDFIAKVADATLTPASVGDLTGDGIIDDSDADLAASRIATYKALADKISEKQGYTATTITNGTDYDSSDPYGNTYSSADIFKDSTNDLDVLHGMIQIKGLVPGVEFTIKEHAEVSGTQVTQGSINSSGSQTVAEEGSGLGAVTSAKQALSDAIVGKQRDVYRPSDLGIEYNATSTFITSPTEFDYSISIYDKDLEKNITLTAATSPLAESVIGTPLQTVLENLAEKINDDINLNSYIKAEVINGNLVVKTLNSNSDVEFSGTLKSNVTTFTPVALNTVTSTSATSTDSTPNAGTADTSSIATSGINFPITGIYTFTYNDGSPQSITLPTGTYASAADIATAVTGSGSLTSGILIAESGGILTLTASNVTNLVSGGSLTGTTVESAASTDVANTSTFTIPTDDITFPTAGTITLDYTNDVTPVTTINLVGPFADITALKAALIAQTAGTLTITNPAGDDMDITDTTGTTTTVAKLTYTPTTPAATPTSTDSNNAGASDTSMVAIPANLVYPLPSTGTYTFNYNDSLTGNNTSVAHSLTLTGPFTDQAALGAAIVAAVNAEVSGDSVASYLGGTVTLTAPSIISIANSAQLIAVAPGNTTGTDGTNSTTVSNLANDTTNVAARDTSEIILPSSGIAYPVSQVVFSFNDGSAQSVTLTGPFANKDAIGDAMAAAANNITGGIGSYDPTTGKLTLTASTITGDMKTSVALIDGPDKSILDLSTFTFPLTTNETIELTYNDNGTSTNVQINPGAYADADALGNAIALLSGSKVTYDSVSKTLTMLADNGTDSMSTSKLIITTNTLTEATGLLDKNADYSGRQGAGAEFMEIVTTIDQTTTQDSLQLRLDTLNISDSAFGEFSVDESGLITMKQDGAEYAIGQIAVAKFNNMRGLEAIGDNLFQKTNNSGDAIFNVDNNKTALIESKSLELSTADLSESLVNLMVFQRAFEANAKSITTADSLLTTLIALKR